MTKTINLKICLAIIVALSITAFALIKLNIKTVEVTHDVLETTKDLIDVRSKTKVHDNSNENQKLHIVYEIYGTDSWGARTTIKYGISSRKNYERG